MACDQNAGNDHSTRKNGEIKDHLVYKLIMGVADSTTNSLPNRHINLARRPPLIC